MTTKNTLAFKLDEIEDMVVREHFQEVKRFLDRSNIFNLNLREVPARMEIIQGRVNAFLDVDHTIRGRVIGTIGRYNAVGSTTPTPIGSTSTGGNAYFNTAPTPDTVRVRNDTVGTIEYSFIVFYEEG